MRRYLPWFLSVVVVTVLCLLVEVTVQQTDRMTANDPQIQLAEDIASAFQNNQFTDETIRSSFDSFTPTNRQIDLVTSLSPWIQMYDESDTLVESSVKVSDAAVTLKIPKGIFASVDKSGEDRVTWQPGKNIRQAIVVTKFSGAKSGYIVAGRSLRETEIREESLFKLFTAAWLISMFLIGTSAAWIFGYFTKFQK